MKTITLVENTSANESCIAEHGLSIYIETEKHKLLLDTGQTDAVVKNAETLGIDLSKGNRKRYPHAVLHQKADFAEFLRSLENARFVKKSKWCPRWCPRPVLQKKYAVSESSETAYLRDFCCMRLARKMLLSSPRFYEIFGDVV